MGSCEVGQTALGGRSQHSGVWGGGKKSSLWSGGEPSLWSRALTFARWSMWPKGTYDMSSEAEGGNICWVIDR